MQTRTSKVEGRSIAVACAGNRLVGYDAIGPKVYDIIEQRKAPNIDLFNVGSSPLAILDRIDKQDMLIVIDACIGLASPGEVIVAKAEDVQLQQFRCASAHQVGPLDTLEVARKLFPERMPAEVYFILIETSAFDSAQERNTISKTIELFDILIE